MNEENNLPRLAIDTNNVVSGTISPNSASRQLIMSWTQSNFTWVMSQDTFAELKEVLNREKLRTSYRIDEKETHTFLETLSIGAEFVTPIPLDFLPIHFRDKKDDIMLACALGGNCDFLITGNEDLLVLNGKKELGELQIIKVADFFAE